MTNLLYVVAERARPYLLTTESGDNGTDFINAVFVDVSQTASLLVCLSSSLNVAINKTIEQHQQYSNIHL